MIATPGFGWSDPGGVPGVGRARRRRAAPDRRGARRRWRAWCRELVNDLEPAAERVEPRLAGFRDAVAAVAGAAPMLAGSGSSYWVPCADAETAACVAARVRDELGVTTFAGRVLRDAPG